MPSNYKNITIWASGTGSNAQKIIEYFSNHPNIKIALLISNKPNIPFNQFSQTYNIPLFVLQKSDFIDTNHVIELLEKYNIDLNVLAGFLWKIPSSIIQHYPNKIINIHPSLLPKYGGKGMFGANVHQAVWDNKEKESGITIHYVNANYDEGNIIYQESINIEQASNAQEIQKLVLTLEHKNFAPIVESVLIKD